MRKLGIILLAGAFICLLGTAGLSDNHAISLGQAIIRSAVCLLVGGIGFGIMYITEGGN